MIRGLLLAIAACATPPPPALDRDPAACAACHPAELASWTASRHAASFVDGAFQAELAARPSTWCLGCHAPLDTATGVACLACHLVDGELISSGRAAGSPHATRVDPAFGAPADCARCHQFTFPVLDAAGRFVRATAETMQDTVAQAARAGVTECTGCHDPHRIPGSHEPAMVARALTLATCTTDEGGLHVALTNDGAGHHVPTGGIDRRIALRVWRPSAPERLAERVLGRTFAGLAGGGKRMTSDTTLPPGATTQLVVAPDALGGRLDEPIELELRYLYALDEHAALPHSVVARTVIRRRFALGELSPCRHDLHRLVRTTTTDITAQKHSAASTSE
jgi:hypothetical protein